VTGSWCRPFIISWTRTHIPEKI